MNEIYILHGHMNVLQSGIAVSRHQFDEIVDVDQSRRQQTTPVSGAMVLRVESGANVRVSTLITHLAFTFTDECLSSA